MEDGGPCCCRLVEGAGRGQGKLGGFVVRLKNVVIKVFMHVVTAFETSNLPAIITAWRYSTNSGVKHFNVEEVPKYWCVSL